MNRAEIIATAATGLSSEFAKNRKMSPPTSVAVNKAIRMVCERTFPLLVDLEAMLKTHEPGMTTEESSVLDDLTKLLNAYRRPS